MIRLRMKLCRRQPCRTPPRTMLLLTKKRRYPGSKATNGVSVVFFSTVLLILCAIVGASGKEERSGRGHHRDEDRITTVVVQPGLQQQQQQQQQKPPQPDRRRHLKKKGSAKKHFSLDTLVDGYDGDDAYFVSYNDNDKKKKTMKSKGQSGKTGKTEKSKKCKGKAGKKKKKKKSSSSSSSSDDSDVPDDCTSEPTMLSNTTDPPTLTPTIEPTAAPTVSPTLQPTITSNSTSADDDTDNSDSSSKKSKKKKSKKKKSKKNKKQSKKSKLRSDADESDDTTVAATTTTTNTTRAATRSSGNGTYVKGKLVPKSWRSEVPINIPFPAKAPMHVPLRSFVPSSNGKTAASKGTLISFSTDTPSAVPILWSTLASSSSKKKPLRLIVDTSAPAMAPTVPPNRVVTTNIPSTAPPTMDEESSSLLESESADDTQRASDETDKARSAPVLVEASPFYITFSLGPALQNPSRSAMHETITVSTTFLDDFVTETFSLVDASMYLGLLVAHSFSVDVHSLELMTVFKFDGSSDFIPGTEDIDMLMQIAFTEPSVSTLLTLLSELPPDNPFQQTVSVSRTAGHLELSNSQAAVAPSSVGMSSTSDSSRRGLVAGICAAAFLVAAFAAAFRNRHKCHRTRRLGYSMTRADVTGTGESTCLSVRDGPPLIERLVDDDSETNTIEFYSEGEDDPDQSQQGSLFESPFLHAELPRKLNEV